MAKQDEIIPVEDINKFIEITTRWHEHQVQTLKYLHDVPEGMEVSIGEDEVFKLEGDALKGFKVGVQLGLHYLGTLPFVAEYEKDESSN